MSQVGFSGVCNFTPTSIVNAVRVAAYGTVGGAGESCAPGGSPPPPGPVAALDLDFTTGVLDSRITFTRASQASYFDSAGQMQIAAVNQPRFDYDPVTLQLKGLFLEPTATNLLTNSAAPSIGDSFSTSAGLTYTISFYGSGSISFSDGTYLTGAGAYPTRRTYTGTFATTGTWTVTAVVGDVRYAQVENSIAASSWIPTTTTQATRASESAVITGTNFSSWYPSATALQDGTLYGEFIPIVTILTYLATILRSPTDCVYVYKASSTVQSRIYIGDGSASGSPAVTTGVSSVKTAFGYSYTTNESVLFANGLSSGVRSITATPTVILNQMHIGASRFSLGLPSAPIAIKALRWYSSKLSDTELQALTT